MGTFFQRIKNIFSGESKSEKGYTNDPLLLAPIADDDGFRQLDSIFQSLHHNHSLSSTDIKNLLYLRSLCFQRDLYEKDAAYYYAAELEKYLLHLNLDKNEIPSQFLSNEACHLAKKHPMLQNLHQTIFLKDKVATQLKPVSKSVPEIERLHPVLPIFNAFYRKYMNLSDKAALYDKDAGVYNLSYSWFAAGLCFDEPTVKPIFSSRFDADAPFVHKALTDFCEDSGENLWDERKIASNLPVLCTAYTVLQRKETEELPYNIAENWMEEEFLLFTAGFLLQGKHKEVEEHLMKEQEKEEALKKRIASVSEAELKTTRTNAIRMILERDRRTTQESMEEILQNLDEIEKTYRKEKSIQPATYLIHPLDGTIDPGFEFYVHKRHKKVLSNIAKRERKKKAEAAKNVVTAQNAETAQNIQTSQKSEAAQKSEIAQKEKSVQKKEISAPARSTSTASVSFPKEKTSSSYTYGRSVPTVKSYKPEFDPSVLIYVDSWEDLDLFGVDINDLDERTITDLRFRLGDEDESESGDFDITSDYSSSYDSSYDSDSSSSSESDLFGCGDSVQFYDTFGYWPDDC